jgi:hypothetical protein
MPRLEDSDSVASLRLNSLRMSAWVGTVNLSRVPTRRPLPQAQQQGHESQRGE